jgi:mRNA interferase MazF
MTKTPSTTKCSPGDVVLVRFPFTDLSSAKQRPAVVVSPSAFTAGNGDDVVVAVTSKEQPDAALALAAWKSAGLVKPTWFKPLIATLASSIVVKRLGTLAPADRARLAAVLGTLVDRSLSSPQ